MLISKADLGGNIEGHSAVPPLLVCWAPPPGLPAHKLLEVQNLGSGRQYIEYRDNTLQQDPECHCTDSDADDHSSFHDGSTFVH